jgi:predicted anti-sigma-YlaC factor YlaD
MIPLESVSELLGGSPARARDHYRLAVELSRGERASPHVTFARSVAVAAQDRRGFRVALDLALAVDLEAAPAERLANRLAQERARLLLARADELFFEEESEP